MNKFAIIDKRFVKYGEELKKHDFKIIESIKIDTLYESVKCHADMQFAVDINEKTAFVENSTFQYYSNKLEGSGYNIISGEMIESEYPHNIKYNVVIGNGLIAHNLKYTARVISDYYINKSVKRINLKQGYTKCSLVNINGKYITEDENIYKAFVNSGERILKIRKGYVRLEGFEYGFIGGATGYHDGVLYFCGDVSKHPDYNAIREFSECKIEILGSGELTDVGSIILL